MTAQQWAIITIQINTIHCCATHTWEMHKQKQSPNRELWHHVTSLVKIFYYNRHGNLIQLLFTLKFLLHFTVFQHVLGNGMKKLGNGTASPLCLAHLSSIKTDQPLSKIPNSMCKCSALQERNNVPLRCTCISIQSY